MVDSNHCAHCGKELSGCDKFACYSVSWFLCRNCYNDVLIPALTKYDKKNYALRNLNFAAFDAGWRAIIAGMVKPEVKLSIASIGEKGV